jgi:GNAT superfamily N-acetyltransferase
MENAVIQNVSVRPVLETDAVHVAKILRATGWIEHLARKPFGETGSRIKRHIALCRADDCHSIYVAQSAKDGVIGYASAHWLPYLFLSGSEGYLSELFVEETQRGKGIGKRLLEAIVSEAKNRGCSQLMLITSRSRESYKRESIQKRVGLSVMA